VNEKWHKLYYVEEEEMYTDIFKAQDGKRTFNIPKFSKEFEFSNEPCE
jgi:hypothetical protein